MDIRTAAKCPEIIRVRHQERQRGGAGVPPDSLRRGDAAGVRGVIIVAVWTSDRDGSAVIAGSITITRRVGARRRGTDHGSTDRCGADAHRHTRADATVITAAINAAAIHTSADTPAIICGSVS
jgi:hypothetical protein